MRSMNRFIKPVSQPNGDMLEFFGWIERPLRTFTASCFLISILNPF